LLQHDVVGCLRSCFLPGWAGCSIGLHALGCEMADIRDSSSVRSRWLHLVVLQVRNVHASHDSLRRWSCPWRWTMSRLRSMVRSTVHLSSICMLFLHCCDTCAWHRTTMCTVAL
jgi:hypothetical protein